MALCFKQLKVYWRKQCAISEVNSQNYFEYNPFNPRSEVCRQINESFLKHTTASLLLSACRLISQRRSRGVTETWITGQGGRLRRMRSNLKLQGRPNSSRGRRKPHTWQLQPNIRSEVGQRGFYTTWVNYLPTFGADTSITMRRCGHAERTDVT